MLSVNTKIIIGSILIALCIIVIIIIYHWIFTENTVNKHIWQATIERSFIFEIKENIKSIDNVTVFYGKYGQFNSIKCEYTIKKEKDSTLIKAICPDSVNKIYGFNIYYTIKQ